METSNGGQSAFASDGGASISAELIHPAVDTSVAKLKQLTLMHSSSPTVRNMTPGPFAASQITEQPSADQGSLLPQWSSANGAASSCASPTASYMERSKRFSSRAKHGKGPSVVFIIGVAGGTASGKTTVCDRIYQRMHDDSAVSILSQDSFYKELNEKEKEAAARNEYNFDHPDAFDEDAIINTLMTLKEGKPADIPIYDFNTHARCKQTRRVDAADVVIIEGILVLHMARISKLLNLKIYVDTDDDLRLARRIQRDVAERGRDVAGVIAQYTKFVKPAQDQFVSPSRRHADVIIPWGKGDNVVAIELITEHIRMKLGQHPLRRVYPNLEVLQSSFQTRGMHTSLRDTTTGKNQFCFMADRLIRLVVEAALGHLPHEEYIVTTPTGHPYVGCKSAVRNLCGVSIIRSGEAMENALRACVQGVSIGKILVHRHKDDPALDVIFEKLPSDIAERHVLLMDACLSTGNTAVRAINTLLRKGVQADRILFLSIMAAPQGIHKVCTMFPSVKVITSEIDDGLNEECLIVPGCGNFGDRYFCE